MFIDGPSPQEYLSRSPEGMVAGLGAARRSGDMTTPRLPSTQADPPRGWSPGLGRPGAPAPTFPAWNDDPSSREYARRSPAGMARGPWGGPANARKQCGLRHEHA